LDSPSRIMPRQACAGVDLAPSSAHSCVLRIETDCGHPPEPCQYRPTTQSCCCREAHQGTRADAPGRQGRGTGRPLLIGRRAGQSATGYALRAFPRAINTASRSATNQTRTYTYPQPTVSTSASIPSSILSRHGGSNLNRRGQFWSQRLSGKRRTQRLRYCSASSLSVRLED
jgi:hypothetical protein